MPSHSTSVAHLRSRFRDLIHELDRTGQDSRGLEMHPEGGWHLERDGRHFVTLGSTKNEAWFALGTAVRVLQLFPDREDRP